MSQEREDYAEPVESRWPLSDRVWFAAEFVLYWSIGVAVPLMFTIC
jgi:hypothetical protein